MMLPKNPPLRDKGWLKHVRTLPCVLSHCSGSSIISVVAAHIRYGLSGGAGLKPPDNEVLPLRSDLHDQQHNIGEVRFWQDALASNPEFAMRCVKALAREMYREWRERR